MKFLSHSRVETRISHTAKNRNCAVSLVRNKYQFIIDVLMSESVKYQFLIDVFMFVSVQYHFIIV